MEKNRYKMGYQHNHNSTKKLANRKDTFIQKKEIHLHINRGCLWVVDSRFCKASILHLNMMFNNI